MATKSRNTNFISKFICVVLSILLMTGAFFFAVRVAETATYVKNSSSVVEATFSEHKSLKNCWVLTNKIVNDFNYLQSLTDDTSSDNYVDDIEIARNALITQAMIEFRAEKNTFYSSQITQTTAYYENYSIDDAVDEDDDNEEVFDFQCDVPIGDMTYTFYLPGYVTILLSEDEDSVREELNDAFTKFVSDTYDEMYDGEIDLSLYILPADLYYYVYNRETKETATNFADTSDIENVTEEYEYALSVIDGVPTYSQEFEGVLDCYYKSQIKRLYLAPVENCDFVIFIDTDLGSYSSGSYAALISNFKRVSSYHTKRDFAIGLTMGILALILAVYVFIVSGKRLENGKVKKAWVDYIPTDLHLILSGGAILGLVGLIIFLFDQAYLEEKYDIVMSSVAGIVLSAGLIWSILIEFVTSFIRVCRSEKGLWNNLFVVMIVKYLLVKPIAAIVKAVKTALTYHPENFKKQLRNFLIAYGGINLILFAVILLSAAADNLSAIFLTAIVMIIGNIGALVYIIRYVIYLDRIITSARLRTAPQVDYGKLPKSLKILASSLYYTRQELDTAVSKAVKDERMRTELITNVSHDLRTPLTSVITYVDLLKQCDVQDENAKGYIEVIDEKGKRLKRLIDDLIEASKISSGVITLNPIMMSLSELAAQAVYERQQEFIDNHLEIVFKGDKNNVNCYADGNKTFRILDNLLSNAKKYSAYGTRVYCDVYETQNFSIFEIKNISAQALDISPQELTERFVRGDKSRNNEGNGLGLSIADNLCKAQGGKLNITIDGDMFKAQVMLPKHQ